MNNLLTSSTTFDEIAKISVAKTFFMALFSVERILTFILAEQARVSIVAEVPMI